MGQDFGHFDSRISGNFFVQYGFRQQLFSFPGIFMPVEYRPIYLKHHLMQQTNGEGGGRPSELYSRSTVAIYFSHAGATT